MATSLNGGRYLSSSGKASRQCIHSICSDVYRLHPESVELGVLDILLSNIEAKLVSGSIQASFSRFLSCNMFVVTCYVLTGKLELSENGIREIVSFFGQ